jgi:hypothetical protein
MHFSYDVAVHVDGEGGAPYYILNMEGCGEKQTERQCLFPVASDSQEKHALSVTAQVPSNFTSKGLKPRKIDMLRMGT